jgi:hypothetical protein
LSGIQSPWELNTASVFHKKQARPIPMNSGTTKIFALSDPENIAIYDGRVGAGLALLSIDFLTSDAGANFRSVTKDKANAVPPALRWRWGEGRTTVKTAGRRDPNTDEFQFSSLSSASSLAKAHDAWRASRLFKAVIDDLAKRNVRVLLPDIERAFFMIGYDLDRSE